MLTNFNCHVAYIFTKQSRADDSSKPSTTIISIRAFGSLSNDSIFVSDPLTSDANWILAAAELY